jgi:PAS domain S-box-containing protein
MYLLLSQIAALFSFLIAFYLGAYVLFQSPRARLNRVFSFFSFAVAALGFGEFMLRSSSLPGPALFWAKIIWLSFALIPGLFLHLSLLISGFWEKVVRSFYLLIYLPALPIIILLLGSKTIISAMAPSYLGYSSIKGPLFLLNPLYLTLWSLVAIALLAHTYRNAATIQVRKQTGYMLTGVLVQFFLSGLSQSLLPALGIATLPVGNLPMLIGLFFFTAAIIKYGLMNLTLFNSAEAIIASLSDALIMINLEGKITAANQAASSLFELPSQKILALSINNLFPDKTSSAILSKTTGANLFATIQSARGQRRPVNLNFSAVKNHFGEIIGQVIIAHDLQPASQLVQELETTQLSLEEKVAARTAEVAAEKNNLEKQAAELTAELRARAKELQFFEEASFGREARIDELENELGKLKIELEGKIK